jgi:hypothetical protein
MAGKTAFYNPLNSYAKRCFEEYFEFRNANRHRGDMARRLSAMRYEPDMWLCGVVLLGALCGVGQEPLWLAPLLALGATFYGVFALTRVEAVERRFYKQCDKGAIVLVPDFLSKAVKAEAASRKLTDWGQWHARRFTLFAELLSEESVLLAELENDCGCEQPCSHTNRLPNYMRTEAQEVLRAKANAKLDAIAEEHRGALDANNLRLQNMRDMLTQERRLELPPAGTEEE